MKLKKIITLILMLSLCMALCACTGKEQKAEEGADYIEEYSASAQETEEITQAVRRELAAMQELGLVSKEVDTSPEPDYVGYFDDEWTEGPFWSVRWYGDRSHLNDWEGGSKYSIVVNIHSADSRINYLSIEAAGDEDDENYEEVVSQLEHDPETGKDKPTEVIWRYYENYGDIFPEDMTVDKCCELISQYWGCDGYTLLTTEDYGYSIMPQGDMPLKDMKELDMNFYVTAEFEGGENAGPCYIQTGQFPARVFFNIGTSHTKG